MATSINTDELFLDLIREKIVEAIDDSKFMIEHDNGCRHGVVLVNIILSLTANQRYLLIAYLKKILTSLHCN